MKQHLIYQKTEQSEFQEGGAVPSQRAVWWHLDLDDQGKPLSVQKSWENSGVSISAGKKTFDLAEFQNGQVEPIVKQKLASLLKQLSDA